MASGIHYQLWMGSLEPYMTENFILAAFRKMGENPRTVRVMRNKITGEPCGYCFINFLTDEEATNAMHKLNGKPIPTTNPIIRFRLNCASNSCRSANEREFSIWVGDLSSDVDDYTLYQVFSKRYNSIKTAKVILDSSGFSKGYGFVRFGIKDEQKAALAEMIGFIGLGNKPIKVSDAIPKPKAPDTTELASYAGNYTTSYDASANYYDYSTYYNYSNDWQNYWQNYSDSTTSMSYSDVNYRDRHASHMETASSSAIPHQATKCEDESGAYYENWDFMRSTTDVDNLNQETVERDQNLWDALESSKWLPLEQLEEF